MGIREAMQKRNGVAIAAASVLIVGSIAAIVWQAQTYGAKTGGEGFFTIDDGQTFFIDDATKIPPFDKDGKQAVRAHVFECGGKHVVGYVSRYTPEAVEIFADVKAAQAKGERPKNVHKLAMLGQSGIELKKPGAKNKWVRASDPRVANTIRVFKCPDGKVPPELYPD